MKTSNLFRMRGSLSAAAVLLIAGVSTAQAQSSNFGVLGDPGGLRGRLAGKGITFGVTDSENLLGNLTGGVKTGATMQGVLTVTVDVDTAKAFGLPGGDFHASALQIHGRPLSPYYLDDLQAANGNEAEDASRLWELWYDQKFLNNRFDIKIGQQSIDNEFIISSNSALFVNTMAGWPLIPSDDLYGGGPAYPLASLGIRLRTEPGANTALLAGVFDDNPGGGGFTDDAQALDGSGARFNLNTGALFIAEIQQNIALHGLGGSYKLGGWYDTGKFPDQEFDSNGNSLEGSDTTGIPTNHHGNYSVYGVVDQAIWQAKSRSLNIFGRIMGAPAQQNPISFSFNGGLTLAAPFTSRPNDTAGINFGFAEVSSRVADLDADSGLKRQGTEELVEITYQATLAPWLVVQPDLQYIFTPGGGMQDPDDPSHSLRNELVAGARAVVTF